MGVCVSAPRLDRRLLERVVRLDDPSVPIAETYRRSREDAAQLDIPRPSYECVRQLIHDARRERARRRANRDKLIRVALYLDSPESLSQLDLAPRIRM
jgi:hypothetical protein